MLLLSRDEEESHYKTQTAEKGYENIRLEKDQRIEFSLLLNLVKKPVCPVVARGLPSPLLTFDVE